MSSSPASPRAWPAFTAAADSRPARPQIGLPTHPKQSKNAHHMGRHFSRSGDYFTADLNTYRYFIRSIHQYMMGTMTSVKNVANVRP